MSDSWRRQTKKARRKRRKLFRCGSCGKRNNNPLGHVCVGGGQLKRKRDAEARRKKRAAARATETAARQARRAKEDDARKARRAKERAAARKKKPAARRPARPAHAYQGCVYNTDCELRSCVVYREGYMQGFADKPPEVVYVGGK